MTPRAQRIRAWLTAAAIAAALGWAGHEDRQEAERQASAGAAQVQR